MDPITWGIVIVGSFFTGVAVAVFWDEIKEWATRMLGYILDAINAALEVTSDAVVYLVKEGTRVYKRVEVFVRNVYTHATRIEHKRQEVSPYDVPAELNDQLERKSKVKLMQQQTA